MDRGGGNSGEISSPFICAGRARDGVEGSRSWWCTRSPFFHRLAMDAAGMMEKEMGNGALGDRAWATAFSISDLGP